MQLSLISNLGADDGFGPVMTLARWLNIGCNIEAEVENITLLRYLRVYPPTSGSYERFVRRKSRSKLTAQDIFESCIERHKIPWETIGFSATDLHLRMLWHTNTWSKSISGGERHLMQQNDDDDDNPRKLPGPPVAPHTATPRERDDR